MISKPLNHHSLPLFSTLLLSTVTIFLLEVSYSPFSSTTTMHKTFHLSQPINDPDISTFRTPEGAVIAGFVVFFQNYSTLWVSFGFYIQDVCVRECYRRKGFGRMLMKAVAKQAVDMGYERVEWVVLGSNVNAIKFYEDIGTHVMQEWQKCKLSGDSLLSLVQSND